MKFVLLIASISLAPPSAAAQTCTSDVFVDVFGAGTPGASGIPRLVNVGAPITGTPYHVALKDGPPGSVGIVIASANEVSLFLPPFGGTQYVGAPLLLVQTFGLDGAGAAEPLLAIGAIPPALCGFVGVAQAAVFDGAATGGWALTNALRVGFGVQKGLLFPGQEYTGFDMPWVVRTGDLDEDGEWDVAVGLVGSGGLDALLGHGDGTFAAPGEDIGSGVFHGGALRLADLNGDGHLDAAVGQSTYDRLTIKLGHGDATFEPATTYATVDPQGLDVGDVDLDGALDVLTANSDLDSASVFPNAGDGTFAPATAYPVGLRPYDIAAVDLDGDGLLDLATANDLSGSVTTLLNAGGGAMLPGTTAVLGGHPRSLAAGDLDADGANDLVVARLFGSASVLLGLGDGGFAPQASLMSQQADGILLKDFDADGTSDIALVGSGDVAIRLGLGDGTFADALPVPVSSGNSVASEDFDGDGSLDLAVAEGGISIRLGLGGGFFRSPDSYPVFLNAGSVAAADLDGDAHIDVAVASKFSSELAVLFGEPQGKLAPATFLPETSPNEAYAAVVAPDLDADGLLDLVAAGHLGDEVSVYLGAGGGTFAPGVEYGTVYEPTAVVPADMDGDGALDIVLSARLFDQAAVLRGTGSGALEPPVLYPAGEHPNDADVADLDADGFLDVVVGHSTGQQVLLYLGKGDGTLATAIPLPDMWSNSNGVDVADLDDDGIQDIAAAGSSYVKMWRGLGGALFAPPTPWSIDYVAGAVTAADVTGDGVLDLVVLEWYLLTVLRGIGDGTFGDPLHFTAAGVAGQGALAVVDIDGDGMLDVIAPDPLHEGITVFQNLVLE